MSSTPQLSFYVLIQASLIFAASLAWNGVISSAINTIYPRSTESQFWSQLIYAIILTTFIISLFYVYDQYIAKILRATLPKGFLI